jgi:bifunctional DNA-binding transcriptional regulator/antitoxin component of YhaV-PrlF toxin-antitoxin module
MAVDPWSVLAIQLLIIPAEARRDFGIEVGDKLLVIADLKRGIALAKASVLTGMMAEILEMFSSAPAADEAEEGAPE